MIKVKTILFVHKEEFFELETYLLISLAVFYRHTKFNIIQISSGSLIWGCSSFFRNNMLPFLCVIKANPVQLFIHDESRCSQSNRQRFILEILHFIHCSVAGATACRGNLIIVNSGLSTDVHIYKNLQS